MVQSSHLRARSPHRFRPAVAACLCIALAGCANQSGPLLSTASATKPWEAAVETGTDVKSAAGTAAVDSARIDPKDANATIAAARTLSAAGKRAEALALLEKAAAAQPTHRALLREQGLLALELGQPQKAQSLLEKALAQGASDWQTHSALGAALASLGKHPQAQAQFAKALELAPDHPSILNNLALSYALDGKPAEAERVLRVAAGGKQPPAQVRQNLALVLGAEGKLAEAQKISASTHAGSTNAAYLKALAERAATPAPPDAPLKSADAGADKFAQPYLLGASR